MILTPHGRSTALQSCMIPGQCTVRYDITCAYIPINSTELHHRANQFATDRLPADLGGNSPQKANRLYHNSDRSGCARPGRCSRAQRRAMLNKKTPSHAHARVYARVPRCMGSACRVSRAPCRDGARACLIHMIPCPRQQPPAPAV